MNKLDESVRVLVDFILETNDVMLITALFTIVSEIYGDVPYWIQKQLNDDTNSS